MEKRIKELEENQKKIVALVQAQQAMIKELENNLTLGRLML